MVLIARSSSEFRTEIAVNDQRLIVGSAFERKLIDQPVPGMNDIVAATPEHQHVILVTREPGIEPVEDTVECRPRDQFPALRAEDPMAAFAREMTSSAPSPRSGGNRLLPAPSITRS